MDLAATIEAWLLKDGVSLSMLFVGIVLLSYLLEDLAIVTAATLAVEQVMPTTVALMAIFVGIASGDLGLYLLGKAAHKIRYLRYRLLRHQRTRRVQRKLQQQAFINLFIVRFIPGLRSIGFTLSGFINVPTSKFLFAVVAATGLWTALIFGSFFQLGNVQWLQHNLSSWLLIPLGLCVMLLLNKIMTKTLLRDTYDTAR